MHWVIKFVLNTLSLGIERKQKRTQRLWLSLHSSHRNDKWLCTVCSACILQLKSQRSMTLSSSEAEWLALLKAMEEVMFIDKLFWCMKMLVNLSVMVWVYNVWAIFTIGNIIATSHYKHMDITYKYVNEHVEDRVVKIVFVKAELRGTFSSRT